MVWQNTGKHIKPFIKNVNAPLEHLFNNHEYCKSEWCNALKSKEGGKPYKHLDDFCTWSTTEEEKKYQDIADVTKNTEVIFLRRSMPPFNTQTKEALNQNQACITPKPESFHGSKYFHYCHDIVVRTHNWGCRKYWTQVFNSLDV